MDLLYRLVFALAGWRNRTASDHGQTMAEYSLILTLIAVGAVLAALIVFGAALADAFSAVAACLDGSC